MNRVKQWASNTVAALLLSCVASPCPAVVFNFRHEGFSEGAFVSGSFSGEDFDGNRQLSFFQSEILAFSATFSGNSIIPSFNMSLDDLFGLVYDLDAGPVIGDGLMLDIEGIGFDNFLFSYTTGEGPGPFPGGEITDLDNNVSDFSDLNAIVTLIPEPSSATLLFAVSMRALLRRRRAL